MKAIRIGTIIGCMFLSAFLSFLPQTLAHASEIKGDEDLEQTEEAAMESMLGQLEFEEINQSLEELFPEEKLDFKETVYDLISGEEKASFELLNRLVKDQIGYAFRVNRENLLQILLIAIIAAVFTNFSNVFQNKQISEIGFYVLYLLVIALCLNSFQIAVEWVGDGVEHLLSFMKVLGPVYFVCVALAKGSVTSIAFYNLVLLLIYAIELLILKFLLPTVHIYIMVKILNHLSSEEYLSKFAELMELVIVWTLKTLLACVIGLNVVQGLISPAIDTVKRSIVTRGAEAIPGIGDAIGGTAEVILGTAVLVKNGIGMAGMIVCIALCIGPLVQVAAMVLMYKLGAAVIQPVSDKRLVGCVGSVGDGCQLLLRIIFTTAVLFLLTIAIVAVTTSNV